ncbi:PiggyBac transposable element-derived protein 4 [Trichinella murrelli]|uniref:PiggyBac transposable element-derived protein 4 n=1 Tax=Trichinella murrelli TaxID=144512 RepID=A0A0V0TGG1_9BILA|nr:PiggyBac transposable element-derived protein 4 [Trichinella murrelli]
MLVVLQMTSEILRISFRDEFGYIGLNGKCNALHFVLYLKSPKKTRYQAMIDVSYQIVLQMTNSEGKRLYKDAGKEIQETEFHAYIGLLILTGVYKSHGEATKSLWNTENGRPVFPSVMPVNNFKRISRTIQFDDREKRSHRRKNNPFAAIRDVWDDWVARLPMMCNSGAYVTVDERLIPSKSRRSFRQYIPKKPAKYGIKVWTLCDAKTSYAWNMQIYTGKRASGIHGKNQGMRVVIDLTAGLKGNNSICDHFFTSHELAMQLLKTYFVSTFAFSEDCTIISYLPKKNKNVMVLSTMHNDNQVCDGKGSKPDIILHYNNTKGGVDNLDKMTSTYSCQRMTARWPLVIFYNIIDVSAYNAYVLWTEKHPAWNVGRLHKRRLFLEELGKALVQPEMMRRKTLPRTAAAKSAVERLRKDAEQPSTSGIIDTDTSGKKRARCQLCASRDNNTSVRCKKCQKYICKDHKQSYCNLCAEEI